MAGTETKASQPEAGNQGVQLGVGTLIIIALIVTMCSGRSEMEKVQKDTTELKQKLEVIDRKLDALALKGNAVAYTGAEASGAPAHADQTPSQDP